MGLLNSALHIGRNAILGYQGALQVVGSNVSSAASPDYTRLTAQLSPLQGQLGADLQPGAGVALSAIQRNIDEALEGRIRLGIGTREAAAQEQIALSRVQALFDDLNGADLSSRLAEFFHSFDDLQNDPRDAAVRELTVSSGVQLAESLRSLRTHLMSLGEDLDGEIAGVVAEVDDLARRVARLNGEITTREAGGDAQATALRDQRDALLRELGLLVEVTVREQPNGALNVYIANEALVQGNVARSLTAVQEADGTFLRTTIRFADTNSQVEVGGGRLAGLIASRDLHAYGRIATIDELAAALIAEVNRVHADGQGLAGISSVTGTQDLLAVDAPLDSPAVGLPVNPRNGSFYITVIDDATGTPVSYRIDVTLGVDSGATTLESLAAEITDQVAGVTATITGDNRLSLTAADGLSFTFGHDGQEQKQDTSGVLTALGINTFFQGTSAIDISVNAALTAQPSLVAAASTFISGDGANAGRIAALETAQTDLLGGESITEFYNAVASAVAVAGAAANDRAEVAEAVLSSLNAHKQTISGVNLDEEAISLVKYERAFQGASRYISVVDELLDQLVLLIR